MPARIHLLMAVSPSPVTTELYISSLSPGTFPLRSPRTRPLTSLFPRYDNILMEESAQILEIETFIPLLLQEAEDGHNR